MELTTLHESGRTEVITKIIKPQAMVIQLKD